MRGRAISILICLAACLVSGCMDKAGDGDSPEGSASGLTVAITSPATGSLLSGDEPIRFEGEATGGRKPFAYRWSSSLDGTLSTKSSFEAPPSEMSRGRYVVTLTATDGAGARGEASITVTVL